MIYHTENSKKNLFWEYSINLKQKFPQCILVKSIIEFEIVFLLTY